MESPERRNAESPTASGSGVAAASIRGGKPQRRRQQQQRQQQQRQRRPTATAARRTNTTTGGGAAAAAAAVRSPAKSRARRPEYNAWSGIGRTDRLRRRRQRLRDEVEGAGGGAWRRWLRQQHQEQERYERESAAAQPSSDRTPERRRRSSRRRRCRYPSAAAATAAAAAASHAAAAAAVSPIREDGRGNGDDGDDLDEDNPLPGVKDAITLAPIRRPAMSKSGHVIGYASWLACLNAEPRNRCPFTKQHVSKEELTILTVTNIERYRHRLILP